MLRSVAWIKPPKSGLAFASGKAAKRSITGNAPEQNRAWNGNTFSDTCEIIRSSDCAVKLAGIYMVHCPISFSSMPFFRSSGALREKPGAAIL